MSFFQSATVHPAAMTGRDRAQRTLMRIVFGLPRGVKRRMAGSEIRVGRTALDLDAQLLITLTTRSGYSVIVDGSADASRKALSDGAPVLRGRRFRNVSSRPVRMDIPTGELDGRLYAPGAEATPGALLVFFHGGGWVVGDVESYDYVGRFLAHHASMRVLAVECRQAPENPFPAAFDDALAAFRWVHANAAALGTHEGRIAVGGDSAGANLAAALSVTASLDGGPVPAFQMLLYPATDLASRRPSRDTFGEGYMLTDSDIEWCYDAYAASTNRQDPRLSPLRGTLSSRVPAAYIATAGYDPLGDDGIAYAEALKAAGVDTLHARHDALIHGYLSFVGLGGAFETASIEACRALATGIANKQG